MYRPVRRLLDLLWITRAQSSAVAAGGYFAGARLGVAPASLGSITLESSAVFMAIAAGFVWHDIQDRSIDAINNPTRPIPSARVSVRAAVVTASVLALSSVLLSLSVRSSLLLLCLSLCGSIVLYSSSVKRITVVKDLYVSVWCMIPFAAAAASQASLGRLLLPISCCVLVLVAREFVLDTRDVSGDNSLGTRTLAHRVGVKHTAWMASTLMVLGGAGMLVMTLRGEPEDWRWAMAATSAAPILVAAFVSATIRRATRLRTGIVAQLLLAWLTLQVVLVIR